MGFKLPIGVKFDTATTGTGAIAVGAAKAGFRTPAQAGMVDGDRSIITIRDGSAWEVSFTTASNTAATLSRTLIESSTGALLNLSGDAVVHIGPIDAGLLGRRGVVTVRVAAAANVAFATDLEAGDTLDGVTLAAGDAVLLAGQTAAAENGIRIVPASGSAARHPQFAAYDDHVGLVVHVAEGTALGGTMWHCTAAPGGTLDTTAIPFVKNLGNIGQGKHAIQLWPGSFMEPDSAAPEYLKVSATNQLPAFGFDSAADEELWFAFRAAKSSDEAAGFTFQYTWSHPSTTTNFGVAVFVEMVAVGNDELISSAMGTAVEVDDTGGTTDKVYFSPESGVVTPGNTWAEGDLIIGRIYRDVSDAFDDLAVDWRLHILDIFVTLNAPNDA